MDRREHPNLDILELAIDRLGPLVDELVLLGGCAVELLLTDTAAPPVRPTLDVDVIVEAGSLPEYYRLADRLRERGFSEDQRAEAPVCRWVSPPVSLDVMPTHPNVLGFGNAWSSPALNSAQPVTLPSGRTVRLVTAPYFIATKFAAFESRGADDYMMSHDLEDIVAVVDGRQEIVAEVEAPSRCCAASWHRASGAWWTNPGSSRRYPASCPGIARVKQGCLCSSTVFAPSLRCNSLPCYTASASGWTVSAIPYAAQVALACRELPTDSPLHRRRQEDSILMELEILLLPFAERPDVALVPNGHAHALERIAIGDRRDDQIAVSLEGDEAPVEQMIDDRRQQQAAARTDRRRAACPDRPMCASPSSDKSCKTFIVHETLDRAGAEELPYRPPAW